MANKLKGGGGGRRGKKKGGDNVVSLNQNGAAAAADQQDPQASAGDSKKPLGNVTDETIQELCLDYKAKRDTLQATVDQQRKDRAEVSAVKKRAKKLGFNEDYLNRWYDMRGRDPKDVEKEVAEFNRILVAMRFPVGYQLGLFADGETVATKIDNASKPAQTTPESVQKAWHEGHQAAADGKAIDSNPHPLESAEWKGFEDGYGVQQAAAARAMGGAPAPAEGATAH